MADTSRVGASQDVGEFTVGDLPGTHDVTVSKGGYQDWTDTGVRVVSGECGEPATIHLVARMIRNP
jgi:hypothetical protein